MHLAFLRLSLSSPLPSGTVLPLCSVLYLSLGAMLEPLCWNAVAMVQIPSTSSTPQPTDLKRFSLQTNPGKRHQGVPVLGHTEDPGHSL